MDDVAEEVVEEVAEGLMNVEVLLGGPVSVQAVHMVDVDIDVMVVMVEVVLRIVDDPEVLVRVTGQRLTLVTVITVVLM